MRTYGRSPHNTGPNWVEVDTDANGFDDEVYLTTLAQVLLLFLGESPFYADYGIPAQQAILTQIHPDFYVRLTQQKFARFFASLSITSVRKDLNSTELVYEIAVTTNSGVSLNRSVPVPT